MDRALKERVVGATVLVVIAVLVVPVFLDGPANEPETTTGSVTLPGQDEPSTKRRTIVLERDREQPVPAGTPAGEPRRDLPDDGEPVASTVIAEPQSRIPAPKPEPSQELPARAAADDERPATAGSRSAAAEASREPAAASVTGMWAVQLGSFSDQQNAERLAAALRKEGYAAFLSRVQSNATTLHRVRVGPQQDRASAEKVAAELGSAGHKGQVVPHP